MSKEITKTPIKYFVYCRKSSEKKEKQANSLPAQERELLAIADDEALNVVKIFKESQSAYKKGRPIFADMINRIKKGQANGLMVWALNRIGRNYDESIETINLLEQGVLVEIRTHDKI